MNQEWRDIPGFEGFYQVNENGEVRNTLTGRLIRPDFHYRGYLRVRLFRQGVRFCLFLHRVVAVTFLPNPEQKEYVNHIDRDKRNNAVKNLEWATPTENSSHWIQDEQMKKLVGAAGPASDIPF